LDADARFKKLSEEIFDWFMQFNPMLATFLGIHNYDGELGDISPEAIEANISRAHRYLDALGQIEMAELDKTDQIDYLLLRSNLESELLELEGARVHEIRPSNYPDVCVQSIYLLLVREFAPLPERMASVLSRLRQVPEYLEQARKNVKTPSEVSTRIALESTAGGIAFFNSMIPLYASQVPDLEAELLNANANAVSALERFAGFLKGILPEARGDFALGTMLFNEKMKKTHFLAYDADALLAKGQELLRETEEQLKAAAAQVYPGRDWREVLDRLKEHHPEDPAGLLDYYRTEIGRVKQYVVDNDIVDIPEGEELRVMETPEFLRHLIPYAAYMKPAPFEKGQAGQFLVTPIDSSAPKEVQIEQLKGHNKYGIPVTTLHEAYPGHHLQLVWANRAPTRVRKAQVSTLFAEGWAFYCEELMEQLGYINQPETRLARLAGQLWRAARVVIDASLHTGRMSVDEAVKFLVNRACIEQANAVAEVKRYTESPTQPMCYLIGKLEILDIAAEYKRRAGDRFNLKQFHNQLLSHGTLPPALIRKALFEEV